MSFRQWIAIVVMLGAAACDRNPVGSEFDPYPITEESMASHERIQAFVPVLDYIIEDVLLHLQDDRSVSSIDSGLRLLRSSLSDRDVQSAAGAIEQTEEAIRGYGDRTNSLVDGANLGIIQLALDRACHLLSWERYRPAR